MSRKRPTRARLGRGRFARTLAVLWRTCAAVALAVGVDARAHVCSVAVHSAWATVPPGDSTRADERARLEARVACACVGVLRRLDSD